MIMLAERGSLAKPLSAKLLEGSEILSYLYYNTELYKDSDGYWFKLI